MSAWSQGGDPTAWTYQAQAPTEPHLLGDAFPSQPPSSSNGGQYEQWGTQDAYGRSVTPSGYGRADHASQAGLHGGYQYGDGQVHSSAPSQLHQPQNHSYPPSTYAQPQRHSYPVVTHPPPAHVQPSSQAYLENPPQNPSYHYPPTASELPVPPRAGSRLSATAQRFQNAAPSPSQEPPSALPQPPPSQVPPRNFSSNPRPSPTPAAIQQYHRKVDELAMLEHRLSQLQSILTRGTMGETGPGSSQPILSNQRAHLEVQVREFKNRQLTLLNECDAFTQHFGPASSWESFGSASNGSSQSSGFPGPSQRSRTISSGGQQQVANSGQNRQFPYEVQANGVPSPYSSGMTQAQPYSQPRERQVSANGFDATVPVGANGRQSSQQAGYNDSWRSRSGTSGYQETAPPPQPQGENSFPSYPPHQRFHSSPHPGPSPSYTHLPVPPQPDPYSSSPQHHQRQALPLAGPSNPPQGSSTFSSYHPPFDRSRPSQPLQPYQYQQLESQSQHHLPPHRPSSRPSPASAPAPPPQHQIPLGLQAQMDAVARDQALMNGQSRGNSNQIGSQQNPLQVLIKKAENGEMPVMTMSGLRKQSDIERERKIEEERAKARNLAAAAGGGGETSNGTGKQNGKFPTNILTDLCRQGGGPTLAEMVMTIDHQVFWTQLQQTCSKRNINIFDEVHQGNFVIDEKAVDLLQLFQTVVSRGGGYGKIDAGNAWPHVATLLSISTRSASAQNRIKEIYHRVLAPFEDIWATQMIKLREKQRAMEEARRVLGAMPATSSTTGSPHPAAPQHPSPVPPQPAPSPLATTTHLAPSNPTARRSPAQSTTIPPVPGSSSMFANPIPYDSLPPSDSYAGAATTQLTPKEKSVSSADLLEQALALRNNPKQATMQGAGGASTTNGNGVQQQQQPPTTSPPQETSSTPQESVTTSAPAPAPPGEAPSKSKSPATTVRDPVQSAVAAAGHVAPFSTKAAQLGVGVPAAVSDIGKRNAITSRKRKNDDQDSATEGNKPRAKARNRSTSNLEAPVVGQQTNEPHFNPFEITHFLPFTTAAPTIVPSPTTTTQAPPLYSDPNNSAKSTLSNPSLQPDTSSTSGGSTISPQSVGDRAVLASPGTANETAKAQVFDTSSKLKSNPSLAAAALDPSSSFDSISLFDPLTGSRPGTSWSTQDSGVGNGYSAFDPFGGPGLDGFDFASSSYDAGLNGIDTESLVPPSSSNRGGPPTWSPEGLGGFDFTTAFP